MSKRKKKHLKKLLKHKILRKRNIFGIISITVTLLFIIKLCILNLIPIKYILYLFTSLLIINVLSVIFINVHKKTWLKIIGYCMIGIIAISSCVSLYYVVNTKNFINEAFSTKKEYNKNTYYVVSRKDLEYINSDKIYEIGTFKDSISLNEAIDKLNDKYSVNEKKYDDLSALINDLNNGSLNLALLDKASYEIFFLVSEESNKTDYNVLYEYDTYTKKKDNSTHKKNTMNIYIGGKDFAGLMDFNMIATVNLKTHKVVLTSIPKDYYIEIITKGGRYDKLSLISTYGYEANKESLENLFGITIDYSIIVDSNSLVSIVDYLGGIDFYSDLEYTTSHAMVTDSYNDDGEKLKVVKGHQKLDGVSALTIARETEAFEDGDIARQENCRKIIEAIIKKTFTTSTLLHYNETLNNLNSLYDTDIPTDLISDIAKESINKGEWLTKVQTVTGDEGYESIHLSSLYDKVIYPNYESVEIAKNIINETLK